MLGGKNSVKIPKDLMDKIRKYSEVAGYSGPEEFVIHALEKEIAHLADADSDEDIKNKLKGLGYIS